MTANKAGQHPPTPDKINALQTKGRLLGDGDNMLRYMHCYHNEDNNDCGQVAIAAMLDPLGADIDNLPRTQSDPNDGQMHWNNTQVLQAIKQDGFGPDELGGLCGTTGGQIQRALQHYGFQNSWCAYSGATTHWEDLWQGLQDWVAAGWPAAVLLESGKIPNFPGILNLTGHWPVVYRITGGMVFLANCAPTPIEMTQDAFLDAWNYLAFNPAAYGFNHCMTVPST
jgi:hypothetical protein